MTQYISPLSVLPINAASGLAPKDLKLAKHKLMAEFELTGSTTIPLAGKEFSRNDVLKLFDQLEQNGFLEFHVLVASDPGLLHFLTAHEIIIDQPFKLDPKTTTPEFNEWLTPYFCWAFKKGTLRMFRNVNPEEFEALILSPWWMSGNDEWEAWAGVDQYMQLMLRSLQEVNNGKYHSVAQVNKYASYNFVWLLCNLPENRFGALLNNYAFELMRMAIKEFNNKKRESGFSILGYAKSLRISGEMMQSLIDKEQEMQKIQNKNERTQSRNNAWVYVRVGLFIVYFLSRLATCDSNHFTMNTSRPVLPAAIAVNLHR